MVCIIDDREDVWNYAHNLICVQPYTYFRHTGDINDPKLFRLGANSSRKRKLEETHHHGDRASSKSVVSSQKSETDETNSLNGSEDRPKTPEQANSDENGHKKKNEPHDPDDYLVYLERILRTIHDVYYRIYEMRVSSHLRGALEAAKSLRTIVNESDLPDVKKILPMIKKRVLEGCVITFSGVVPTGYKNISDHLDHLDH